MPYASPSDVQSRLGRQLTADETSQVETLLADAEILIKAKIPDLDEKVTAGTIAEETVVYVTANAVKRLVQNPNGYVSETDGDYTYQINWRLATAELEIADKEWALLGVGSGIFFIHPKVNTPFESSIDSLDPDSPEYAIWAMNSDMFWFPR